MEWSARQHGSIRNNRDNFQYFEAVNSVYAGPVSLIRKGDATRWSEAYEEDTNDKNWVHPSSKIE